MKFGKTPDNSFVGEVLLKKKLTNRRTHARTHARTWLSLYKSERKVVVGFGKKSCVSTGVRKPGNTYASPTAMI